MPYKKISFDLLSPMDWR